MGYLVVFVSMIGSTLLGKVVISSFQIEKYKHASVYGIIAYVSGFFILSFPFTLFHLPWSTYWWGMNIYTFLVSSISIWMLYARKIKIMFSWKHLREYIVQNWVVIGIIFVFSMMYLLSISTMIWHETMPYAYGMAVVDDSAYVMKAAKAIGASDILASAVGKDTVLNVVSFLELLWAYGSEVFHVDIFTFTRTSMSLLVYIFIFFSVDEFLYTITTEKKYHKVKYSLIGFLLLYAVIGWQLELPKFMFLPWFGNVVTTMIYLPVSALICRQSLTSKRMLIFLGVLPFVFVGFSLGAIVSTVVLYPLCTYIWFKYKVYKFKYEKLVVVAAIVIIFIYFAAILLTDVYIHQVPFNTLLWNIDYLDGAGEMSLFFSSFNAKKAWFLILLGVLTTKWLDQKIMKVEKLIIVSILVLLFITKAPYISNIVFGVLGFAYRRFMEGVIFYLIIYGLYSVLDLFERIKFKQLLVFCLSLAIIASEMNGVQLIGTRKLYSIDNLSNKMRVLPAVAELYNFFNTIPEKRNVHIYKSPGATSVWWGENKDVPVSVDVFVAVSATKNKYFTKNIVDLNSLDYLIIGKNEDMDTLPEELKQKEKKFVRYIEDEHLQIAIYQII